MSDKTAIATIDPDENANDIMEMMRLTASNINGLSLQMGLVNERIDDMERKFDNHENRLGKLEHNTIINRAEKRQIRKAVMSRVNKVLEIEFDGGKVAEESIKTDVLYRGGFISRCYTDAKNHSKMGESYAETLKVDFDEVMEYIEAWTPEVEGGTDGYKHYLDIRREERQKKQHK